ncbi:hypothetical protein O4H49_03435 [Kiloniella laminariae]|uniref:CopG family transcriptional regulator n=1 Tax=Kiloniella laminariae TaxID=454162 RepID=A0ABT4LFD8_9PROT|nr:hypothetical protein [Kiloniella laminariae]MCZ4279815.1 hypothetical protein [Kiloniella laminariae]
MAYSAKNLHEDLQNELKSGYNPRQISRAAVKIYRAHDRELSPYLDNKLLQLNTMQESPDLEFSEGEFRHLLQELNRG